jgi:hypothetical protein
MYDWPSLQPHYDRPNRAFAEISALRAHAAKNEGFRFGRFAAICATAASVLWENWTAIKDGLRRPFQFCAAHVRSRKKITAAIVLQSPHGRRDRRHSWTAQQ